MSTRSTEDRLPADVWLESTRLARITCLVAHRMRFGRADLDDLVQEVRIRVWKLGPQARVNTSWVFRTASRKAIDLRRRSFRAGAGQCRAQACQDAVELLCLLRARASLLPPNFQRIHQLHLEGLSEREIGRELGLSRATVRRIEEWCRRFLKGRGNARYRAPRRLYARTADLCGLEEARVGKNRLEVRWPSKVVGESRPDAKGCQDAQARPDSGR